MAFACMANAGTLSCAFTANYNDVGPGFSIISGPAPDLFTIQCSAATQEDIHSASGAADYSVALKLTYVGSATDLPPATVNVTCADTITGKWSYHLPAASPGSTTFETARSKFDYTVIPSSGGSLSGNGDSGTITQTFALQGATSPGSTVDLSMSSRAFSIAPGAWTTTTSGTTVTYKYTLTLWSASGTTSGVITTTTSKTKSTAGAFWKDVLSSLSLSA